MATTTLNLYWDLASLDAATRQKATTTLIRSLAEFQLAHEKTLGEAAGGLADTEESLDSLCASDVSYAVRRLLRGLPSSRQGARQGFSLALTELLSIIDCIATKLVLDLLCQYTERTGSMSGEETRDMLFGRLFGIMSIVASGLLTTKNTTTDDVLRMVDLVSEMANAKSYLNEVCYHVIINMLPHVNQLDNKDQVLQKIVELFLRENMANVDEVNLALAIQQQAPTTDLSVPFKGWASQNVFDRANLQHMAMIVREVPMEENDQQVAWTPQLHSIWDRLLATLLSKSNKNNASFHEFWSIVIDANLFGQQSNHGRKYWGFQIFNKVLPQLSTDQVPLIFTENFMRTFMNNLSSEIRFLNKAARQTATSIQQVAEQNKQVGFALVSQLIGKHGSHQFDRLTRTRTVENLLSTMDAKGIRHYLGYLAQLFVHNSANNSKENQQQQENNERTVELQREWAIHQMLLLIQHPKTPKEESWIKDIVQFVMVYTFFNVQEAAPSNEKKKKASKKSSSNKKENKKEVEEEAVDYLTQYQPPTPALTEATLTLCKTKFQSMVLALSKLSPTNKSETGHMKTKRWNGTTNDGKLWADVIYQQYQQLVTGHKHLELKDQHKTDQKVNKATLKLISALKKKQDQDQVAYGFEILFYHVLLYSIVNQEEGTGLLTDLLNCHEKLEQDASKKDGDDDEEPEPIEVIVDILLSFLTSASPMLKGITQHVFELFSPLITKQALENLINIITTNENKEGGEELFGDDDDDEEDDDVEMLDADDVEEIKQNGDADDDSDSDSDDDDDSEENEDENGAVDEELRKKLEEAMRSQGILGGEDSDEELLDDDAMEAFDEKLAEIFKQKKDEKKEKKSMQESVIHFKNNVLELLMIYARKNPTNPLLLGTIVPLLQVIQSTKAKTTVQFVTKVESYLKNKLGKATETPAYGSYDNATLLTIVQSVHTFAIAGGKQQSELACQLLLFLRRCIVGTGADTTTTDVSKDDGEGRATLLKEYMACYQNSLVHFLSKKANQLHTSYFATPLQRFPHSCWSPFMDTLLSYLDPEQCVNAYRHSLACQWTGVLIQQCIGKKVKMVDLEQDFTQNRLPILIQRIQESATKLLDSNVTVAEKSSSHEKMKSLIKLASLVDKTMSRLDAKITTWDTELLDRLAADKHFGTQLVRTTCKSILDRS